MSVFNRFATNPLGEGKKIHSEEDHPYMTLSDIRQFIRLSGLKPFIPNVTCDLHFVRLTRIYDTVSSTVSIKKFRFEEFLLILVEFAKVRFPGINLDEALDRLFREDLYPNILGNLPDLQLEAPPEEESSESEEVLEEVPEVVEEIVEVVVVPEELKVSRLAKKYLPCFSLFFRAVLKFIEKTFKICVSCLNPSDETNSAARTKTTQGPNEDMVDIKEAPSWKEISHIIPTFLSEADAEIRNSQEKKSHHVELNLANLLGIVSDITELYSFSAIGFSEQVGWVYGRSFTDATEIILADSKHWTETFWTCFAFGSLFIILLVPASKFIKEGRLGLNKDFTPAGVLSFQFYLNKTITTIGSSLYLTIIVSMLNALACNFSNGEWHLLRNPNMVCFSNEHLVYFVIALVILLFYYPTATLLYPNIAFQDKVLDLKFDTTFLVLQSQGKLVIAGCFAFFPKEIYISLQLIVASVVCFVLMLISWKMKPCMIERYNLWKSGGFAFPIWICICALINYHTRLTSLAVSLLVIGLVVILGLLVLIHAKLNQNPKDRAIDIVPEKEQPKEIEEPEAYTHSGLVPYNSPRED